MRTNFLLLVIMGLLFANNSIILAQTVDGKRDSSGKIKDLLLIVLLLVGGI